MAARNYPLGEDAIFHSDRGSNYTSGQFARRLRNHGLRQSVGRTGICYDNAMAESFFAALKNERIHRTEYPTREHARRAPPWRGNDPPDPGRSRAHALTTPGVTDLAAVPDLPGVRDPVLRLPACRQRAAGLAGSATESVRRRDQRVLPGSVANLMNPKVRRPAMSIEAVQACACSSISMPNSPRRRTRISPLRPGRRIACSTRRASRPHGRCSSKTKRAVRSTRVPTADLRNDEASRRRCAIRSQTSKPASSCGRRYTGEPSRARTEFNVGT
jgi:hypothetical protein